MAKKVSKPKNQFTRCAVCKVDLKGKFVYIDDKVEDLLGFPKEELFGKSFLDYLDEESQQLVTDMLAQRNNYETFYEATELNIINSSKETIACDVIMSLNFITGNPVNFQVIIKTQIQGQSHREHHNVGGEFMHQVLDSLHDEMFDSYDSLLRTIAPFSKADYAGLYIVNDDGLELKATYASDDRISDLDKLLADIGAFHEDVADEGKAFSFLDDVSVRKGIEKYKSVPNELFFPVELDSLYTHYMRFLYPETFDHVEIQKAEQKLRLMVKTVERLSHLREAFAAGDELDIDIKFTIGFLDSIKIPAFLTNSEGEIVGYNPSMRKYFGEDLLNGNYYDLIKSMVQFNPKLNITEIADYVNSPYDVNVADEKHFTVYLNKITKRRMTILKVGDKETDRSGCFVFVPILE